MPYSRFKNGVPSVEDRLLDTRQKMALLYSFHDATMQAIGYGGDLSYAKQIREDAAAALMLLCGDVYDHVAALGEVIRGHSAVMDAPDVEVR